LTESRINLDSVYSIREESIVLPKKGFNRNINNMYRNKDIQYACIENILKLSLSVFTFGCVCISGVYIYNNSSDVLSYIRDNIDRSAILIPQLNYMYIILIGLSILLVLYMINEYFNKKNQIDKAFEDYNDILSLLKSNYDMDEYQVKGINVKDLIKAFSRNRKISEEEYERKYFYYMKEIIQFSDDICLVHDEDGLFIMMK